VVGCRLHLLMLHHLQLLSRHHALRTTLWHGLTRLTRLRLTWLNSLSGRAGRAWLSGCGLSRLILMLSLHQCLLCSLLHRLRLSRLRMQHLLMLRRHRGG